MEINSLKLRDSNNNIILQGVTIKIEEIPYVAELKAQIEALQKDKETLQDLVETKKEVHTLKILELSGQIANLEKQVEEQKNKIREIAANYENVDIASLPLLHKEAINLFTQGKIDEAFSLLDEAKLEAQEAKLEEEKAKLEAKNKGAADIRILKAQLAELKYDFENAAANYLKAAAIFPSFDNYLLVANFYSDLNQFSEAETYYTQCLTLAKTSEEKATVLNNLGILQRDINENAQAEASYQEALTIYRELAAVNPQTYLPDVAMTLANLAMFYHQKSVRNKDLSVKYAKEVLSYRAALEHIPAARKYITDAEEVLRLWELEASPGLE
jgi:tetratricopeptide (TPR) repeat protein